MHVSATDNCDNNPTVTLNEITIPGACAGSYTLIRTWTATDDCGNSSTGVQTISLGDNDAPVLVNIPADETINCGSSVPSAGAVSATDNCDNNPTVTLNEITLPGACAGSYTLIRTWTATDDCGNSSTGVQSISLGDNEAPQLVNIPANETLACGASVPSPGAVNATDNCDNNPVVTLNEMTLPGACAGSYTLIRTWTATDDCGNTSTAVQTVSVGDNEAPTLINVPQDETIACGASVPSPGAVNATDNCDNNPIVTLNEGTFPGACAGSYTLIRTWIATDDCGNSSTAAQTVSVGDNDAPQFTGSLPADITASCNEVPGAETVQATDNCDAQVSISLSETIMTNNCVNNYFLMRTWTATDNCGNSSVHTQKITVEDNTPPELLGIPTDVFVDLNNGDEIPPVEQNIFANDDCDTNVSIEFNTAQVDNGCGYTIVRTWTATDNCGNKSTQTQNIFIQENLTVLIIPSVANACTGNPLQLNVLPYSPFLNYVWNVSGGNLNNPNIHNPVFTANTTGTVTVQVAVIGVSGCSGFANAVINVSPAPVVSVTAVVPEFCNEQNGMATLSPANLTYHWSDAGAGAFRNNLANGTYFVTATNLSGCSVVTQVTIPENCDCQQPVIDSVIVENATCGAANGSITIIPEGNISDFHFIWNPAVSQSAVATNLAVGEYQVRIERVDDPNCFTTTILEITHSGSIDIPQPAITPADCNAANGSVDFAGAGPNLTFTWPGGAAGNSMTGLTAGAYEITVTDTNSAGCTEITTVTVPQISPLVLDYQIDIIPTCGQNNGKATILVTGGSDHYIYSWAEGPSKWNLSAGTYTVTVTDLVTGCTQVITFMLPDIGTDATLTADTLVYVSCPGAADGLVNIGLTYDSTFAVPATISIMNGDANNTLFTNGALAVGNYCILVTDNNGCLAAQSCFEVANPAPVTASVTVTIWIVKMTGALS